MLPRARRGGPIRALLMLAILAWALRSFVVAPFSIPSGSMLPSMAIGDYLFVSKWPYGFSRYSFPLQIPAFDGRVLGRLPDRGDVVIFKRPDAVGADWVKRVIGLPGDSVSVSGGKVFLNGKALARQSLGKVALRISPNSPCRSAPGAYLQQSRGTCDYPAVRETLPGGRSYLTFDQVSGGPGDDRATIIVPKGQLFLMGDNRDDSLDSRFTLDEGGIGLVPVDRLVGRAAFAFWSTDGSASYWQPWTWISALRFDRIGTSYQP
ncbi:signal peptidase I [Sphingomonas sp.]|uniref:signal peptidase I n=1 Tax=Sphingomonas sp. TaxID=28214 RepID=UPI00386E7F7D